MNGWRNDTLSPDSAVVSGRDDDKVDRPESDRPDGPAPEVNELSDTLETGTYEVPKSEHAETHIPDVGSDAEGPVDYETPGDDEMPASILDAPARRARIIVVGNQKGGSGKSTTAMHLISALMAGGALVASIDLDASQGTLTRYLENREAFMKRKGVRLTMPTHRAIMPVEDGIEGADAAAVEEAVDALGANHDFLVIDTPGTDSYMSRVGHSYADTLITPLNDSFLDLDVLAAVNAETYDMTRPSKYAEMIFQVKIRKAKRDRSNRTFDWVVIRNRVGQLDSRNQRAMDQALEKLAKRVGFRLAPGFSERVIFREMFLDGLTLLDIRDAASGIRMNMSHVAARQEVRGLMHAIGLQEGGSDGTGDTDVGDAGTGAG